MLTLLDRSRDALTRRSFLQCGALTATGLSLADLLRLEASAGDAARVAGKSVILLWMDGGASHIDSFDPKPDAPAEIRGEFQAIATKLPGVQVCEHLPKLAGMMDRLSLVRSLTHNEGFHEGAIHWVQTGHGERSMLTPARLAAQNPAAGAVVAHQCGPVRKGVPPYVKVFQDGGYANSYQGAVYLGGGCEPMPIGDDLRGTAFKSPVADPFDPRHLAAPAIALPADVSLARLQDRRSLVGGLNALCRDLESSRALDQLDEFRREAFELLLSGSVREAFDLSREVPAIRERYGRNLWGQGTLLARRLVEAGVRFVTVNLHGDPRINNAFSWDCHTEIFPGMKNDLLPTFDQLTAALVDDLAQRGLSEQVLVLAVGEFGRSPKVETDVITKMGGAGRNHWPSAFSALVAGGGIQPGLVIGSTDAHGREPRTRPVSPQDLLATVFAALGINLDTVLRDRSNRPVPILPNAKPITELI